MQLSLFFLSFFFQSKHEAQYAGNKWNITIVEFDHNLDCFHCLQQKMPMGFFHFYNWQLLCRVVMSSFTKKKIQFFHFIKSWTL